jgi:hypothetical protein
MPKRKAPKPQTFKLIHAMTFDELIKDIRSKAPRPITQADLDLAREAGATVFAIEIPTKGGK